MVSRNILSFTHRRGFAGGMSAQNTSSELVTGLMALPIELQLQILQQLDTAELDLFVLALTSRHFNHLISDYVFRLHDFKPGSDDVSLIAKDGSTAALLKTLAVSLSTAGANVDHLLCDITTSFSSAENMIGEARCLLVYISKLSSLKKLTLVLMNPYVTEWHKTVWEVLQRSMEKGCHSMNIKNVKSNLWDQKKSASKSPKWLTPMLHWRKQYPLKSCHLQMLPPYTDSFFSPVLNRSNMTEIGFKYIYNAQDWGVFLDNLQLPHLRKLVITFNFIPLDSFIKFLPRHPSITWLELHHCMLLPIGRMKEGILPNLTHVETSADYVINFLPPLPSFPKLQSVKLHAGDRHHQFERVNIALAVIGDCARDIRLELLCFSGPHIDFDSWIDLSDGGERVERRLRCVKQLVINKCEEPFSDVALDRVPEWLGCFPVLQEVSFTSRCFVEDLLQGGEFVHEVSRRCGSLVALSLIEMDGNIGWRLDLDR